MTNKKYFQTFEYLGKYCVFASGGLFYAAIISKSWWAVFFAIGCLLHGLTGHYLQTQANDYYCLWRWEEAEKEVDKVGPK